MGFQVLHYHMFFLLSLFLISDSSIAEKPPPEAIQQKKKLENQIIFSPLKFTTKLESAATIPIINPTTPSSPTTVTPSSPTIVIPSTPTTVTPSSPTIVTPSSPTMTTPIVASPPPPATTQPTPTTPASSGGTWCIASPTASETALQVALDYACGYGGADCSALQSGASCYNPNTVRDHASYAFNNYYQKNPSPTSCVFGGTAQLTYTDPSSGNCHYATPTTAPSTPSSLNSPPSSMMNPTPPSSIFPATPSVPTDYGSEPTATPSSAYSASLNLLLLFTTSCLSTLAANYL